MSLLCIIITGNIFLIHKLTFIYNPSVLLVFQYAPYKPGNKGSLAERARALGLEPLALQFVNGDYNVQPVKFVQTGEKGLCFPQKVLFYL